MSRADTPSTISPARRAALEGLLRPVHGDATDEGVFVPDPAMEGLSPQDRALAGHIYRGVLQNLRLIDHLLGRLKLFHADRTPKSVLWLLRMAVYQKVFLRSIPDYAIVQQSVEQAREIEGEETTGFVNGVLRRALSSVPSSEAEIDRELMAAGTPPAPALRYSVPPELARALQAGYGRDALEPILRAANEPNTPVWLRVNTLKTDALALKRSLAEDGVDTSGPYAGDQMLLWQQGSARPWDSAAWSRGELTVQDLGASLAAWLLAPRPGERVIDWCAAPGGKAGQLWEMMRGEGELYAYEPGPSRRKVLESSLQRLYGSPQGIRVIGAVDAGAETPSPPPADAILLDAPCLALGLIGRHPEVRWDHRLHQLPRMQRIQKSILEAASLHLKPGGRMLWVTCSPTRSEIEDRLESWTRRHPEDELVDLQDRVPSWARPWVDIQGPFLRTRPDRERVDGFGMGLLLRRE